MAGIFVFTFLGIVSANEYDFSHRQGSVPYDENTHVPIGSSGCGKTSPYGSGKTTVAKGKYAGVEWLFRVYVPNCYNVNTPLPLILQHPGWGLSAKAEEAGCGITLYADSQCFISVTPQGGNDNPNFGSWYSWNAVGSTQSPGPAGPTCTQAASDPSYCYTSCQKCTDSPQCDWTTCYDTVTPTGTGTTDVSGFIPGLYDTLESQLCIDTTREYGAGESNGGMMTYQLGVDLSARLAAIAPQFGSFHKGFCMSPQHPVPVIDIHGTRDTTVPANVSLAGNGYYYTTTAEIFGGGAYCKGWKSSNMCKEKLSHYITQWDGIKKLYCVSECEMNDVVRCSWLGGHNWFANKAADNGGLVTSFLLKWTKTSHIGRGYSKGQKLGPGHLLEDVVIIGEDDSISTPSFQPEPTLKPKSRGHYGNPANGCRHDEDVILIGTGRACAPKVGSNGNDPNAPPVPHCKVEGVAPSANGCPADAPVRHFSKAWPVCLAKGNTTDPYAEGNFHCMLVCPCTGLGDSCGAHADTHCPKGARCERGELRNMAQGVCTYPLSLDSESIVI